MRHMRFIVQKRHTVEEHLCADPKNPRAEPPAYGKHNMTHQVGWRPDLLMHSH